MHKSLFSAVLLSFLGLSQAAVALDAGHLVAYLQNDRAFVFTRIDRTTGEVSGFQFADGSAADSADIDVVRSPATYVPALVDAFCTADPESIRCQTNLRRAQSVAREIFDNTIRVANGLPAEPLSFPLLNSVDYLVEVFGLQRYSVAADRTISVAQLVAYARAGRSFSFSGIDIAAGRVYGFSLRPLPAQPAVFSATNVATGSIRGFLDIAPALGDVASAFNNYLQNGDVQFIAPTSVGEFVNSILLTSIGPGTDTGLESVRPNSLSGSLFQTACESIGLSNVDFGVSGTQPPVDSSGLNRACLNTLVLNTGINLAPGGDTTLPPVDETGSPLPMRPPGTSATENFLLDDALASLARFPDARFGSFDALTNARFEQRLAATGSSTPAAAPAYLEQLTNGLPEALPVDVFPSHPVPRLSMFLETPDGVRLESYVSKTRLPTAGLDELSSGALPAFTQNLSSSTPLIVTYHDASGAQRCSAQTETDISLSNATGCTLVSPWRGPLQWAAIDDDRLGIADVSGAFNVSDTGNGNVWIRFYYQPAVDLATTYRVTPSPAVPGDELSLAIRVTNEGPFNATGVVVDSTLPDSGFSIASVRNGQGRCVLSDTHVLCALGDIAVGDGVDIVIKGTATLAVTTAGSAIATADQIDLSNAPGNAGVTININSASSSDGDMAPLGNHDGLVTVADALAAMDVALGTITTVAPGDLQGGDVAPLSATGVPQPDNVIDMGDALAILRKALGLISF